LQRGRQTTSEQKGIISENDHRYSIEINIRMESSGAKKPRRPGRTAGFIFNFDSTTNAGCEHVYVLAVRAKKNHP
jgi:hypothetical protein